MPTPPKGYFLLSGEKVPGVSQILSRYKDSGGLLNWAWQQGRDGHDFRETRDKAAAAGTLAHALVELYLKKAPDEELERLAASASADVREKGEMAFQNFLHWQVQSGLEIESWEKPLVCEHHKYGGTPDALLHFGDFLAVGDWKSGGVYLEALCQCAAYRHLFEDAGLEMAEGIHIVRFDKEHGDFTHRFYSELDDAWQRFLLARQMYDLDKNLEKRLK